MVFNKRFGEINLKMRAKVKCLIESGKTEINRLSKVSKLGFKCNKNYSISRKNSIRGLIAQTSTIIQNIRRKQKSRSRSRNSGFSIPERIFFISSISTSSCKLLRTL